MYRKIMVPLDGSELAESVLSHVKSVIVGVPDHEIALVAVVEPITAGLGASESGIDVGTLQDYGMSAANEYLDNVRTRLENEGLNVYGELLFGNPAHEIVRYATEKKMELIAIATHGRSGFSRLFFGSVAEKVLRSSPVPVLMVRAPETEKSEDN